MKKKVLYGLILLLLIFCCVSCKSQQNSNSEVNNNIQELQILKSDFKLTPEQVVSRIKAEHIKEHNGYLDNDEIITMISLDGDALIDMYNSIYFNKYKTVSEFVSSTDGQNFIKQINKEQEKLIKELTDFGFIKEVVYQYSTIMNAIAVKTTYQDFRKLENHSSIKSMILSDTYNLPKSIDVDEHAVTNLVDVYETGIFDSSSVSYTGNNTVVAVLDSGFDCSHSVFSNQPREQVITQQSLSLLLNEMEASKTTKGLELKDVYYSKKIPYAYDYADKDADVFPYDSEHGTHVAGIIGGLDDTITGVAVDTQLVLMKVFPDLDEGGKTEDILAALEDAVTLGVDVINMSLGSSCGFAREVDNEKLNKIYDSINESGISLITAASNSYSSGYGGEQGNTNFVTNPDSGTVGSPSTYDAALSVASISGIKSEYMLVNDDIVLFFNESNSVEAKPNHFIDELIAKLDQTSKEKFNNGEKLEFEYVTIPGVGKQINYNSVGDMTGKIALVRRGDNTFEEKALIAKNEGAIACIIYNNVDGDILMSMGKTDHIPTISISKDDGTMLASRDFGKIVISKNYKAGPFMSDFSSWGPTPSLGIKPEITAHGGDIKSSIPGGGYDHLSGTSMATPNLAGIVVLIRQYVKENFSSLSTKEMSVMTNQLMMSTAGIVLNQQGNPYSPRKQGAGLASLYNSVNTKAYITVDGIDRTKLELLDDPDRTGIYEMTFNVKNISTDTLTYDLSVVGMTESVSTSDSKHVAEKSQILDGATSVSIIEGGELNGYKVTVGPNQIAKIKVVYTLSAKDKDLINSLFPYGMYVEGFVKLTSEELIDLNIPFLAFYGDWSEAPMFDKTYFEVESEAYNDAIDPEDKIKADYYATTPYGSYFYNYIIPLGKYLYDVDKTQYDMIPASLDHIAISNSLGTIDGLAAVSAGLLRNAKSMNYTIIDKVSGEVVWEKVDNNASKSYSVGGTPIAYYDYFNVKSNALGLVNNRQYEFKMKGKLDYKNDGEATNVRNVFSFDFYLDDEAPVLKETTYEKVYDKTLKKDRFYLTMTIYDNQYVQSITPIIFTSSSSYTFLTENPIPVYGEKGKDNKVRFEITDFLKDIKDDSLLTNALAFSIDDYALNSNIYLCQLPGTKGDFKFTKTGSEEDEDLVILSMYKDEILDLTSYLVTSDLTVDEDKDYLKFLTWSSSNENVATIQNGVVLGLAAGKTTIVAKESLFDKKAVLIINVKERTNEGKTPNSLIGSIEDAKIEELRFSHFETLFAYSRAAQTSEIGETGDRKFISSMNGISFYPGEKIRLEYDFTPWYAKDKYELTFVSSNPSVASVNEKGEVTALKEGSANITLKASGSNIMAKIKVTVKSEFVIENRTLVAYKGLGGEVVIPDDEGILYIGAYAFCLYDTDQTIELTDEDYDANKIPNANTAITSVVIPHGVEEIQKYAFYNCSNLEKVIIPDTVKRIREFAFYKDLKLKEINLSNVEVIGKNGFYHCEELIDVDLSKMYALGNGAFEGCTSLKSVNLSALRNTGKEVFKECTSLTSVVLNENTKLSYAMFVRSGLVSVDIYEKVQIPEYCFAQCESLEKVTLHNDLIVINKGAFSECISLEEFDILGKVKTIGEQAFYGSTALQTIVLPNNEVQFGNYCFYKASGLTTVEFQEFTKVKKIEGSTFEDTNLTNFVVDPNNAYYSTEDGLLVNKNKTSIIFAATSKDFGSFEIPSNYTKIEDGAFTGINIQELIITNPNLVIGDYAFANTDSLTSIEFPTTAGVVIGKHAFNYAKELTTILNLDKITQISEYAFANSGVKDIVLGDNVVCGEGAFFQSKVENVTIGKNSTFGLGCFQNCSSLKKVFMPEEGGVHFGVACFANDISLALIDLSKTDDTIENEAFYYCTSLKTANLINVKHIGNNAFADCQTLNYINIPICETIGEGSFGRYKQNGGAPTFTELVLPNTLKEVGDGAFLGCSGITEVIIPSSIEKFGDFMFAYCVNLAKVTFPSNMKKVGKYCFAGCELLSKVNLENIETFDEFAFNGCAVLENVDLTSAKEIGLGSFALAPINGNYTMNNLVKVDDYAFQNTRIKSITAPQLKNIGIAAFQNCEELTHFTFSKSLETIKEAAFNGCKKLESFYYFDDLETSNNGKINDYALLDNGILYTVMPSGHLLLTSIPSSLDIKELNVLEDTYRIDRNAGNENKKIEQIVLPDSLKLIGNYAFYGYDNLKSVEFKSFVAPSLEDSYNSKSVVEEDDPGFNQLHNIYDVFGFELYYYNFIDLLGKNEPIEMIVPANEGLIGYDSLVYQVYFNTPTKSNYQAMHKNMIDFISYANQIKKLNVITLSDEPLITTAVTALNSIKQDPTDYGYTLEQWNEFINTVDDAKAKLRLVKIANAGKVVKELQEKVDALPEVFKIEDLAILQSMSEDLNNTTFENKSLLDLERYNNLVASYNAYMDKLESDIDTITNQSLKAFAPGIMIIGLTSTLAMAFVLRRREFE